MTEYEATKLKAGDRVFHTTLNLVGRVVALTSYTISIRWSDGTRETCLKNSIPSYVIAD